MPLSKSCAVSEDADVHHVTGSIDPVRDIGIINTELVLADLENVQSNALKKEPRKSKRQGTKWLPPKRNVLKKFEAHFNDGKPGVTPLQLSPEERVIAKGFYLLTRQTHHFRR